MSIIERLPEVEKSLRKSTREKIAYNRAMERRCYQNAESLKAEVENTAKVLAEKVGLQETFEELKNHLSEQNFNVEIEETTRLQAVDGYYGFFSCEHQWIFRWYKPKQPKVNSFVIYITEDPPFFGLRVSGGGTGEATTDFDLSLGVENIDKDGFKDAVAKAFLKPKIR